MPETVRRAEIIEAIKELDKTTWKLLDDESLFLPRAMDIVAVKCFVKSVQGPAVEVLRRGMQYLWNTGCVPD